MEITAPAIRIAVLFLPGLICYYAINLFTTRKEKKFYEEMFISFILGFLSYFIYAVFLMIVFLFKKPPNKELVFFKALNDQNIAIDFVEVMYVTICSVVLSFVISFIINKRYLFLFAQKLKISQKDGFVDTWEHSLSYQNANWVVVRDLKNDLMYEGWIEFFSDTSEKKELFLRDVIVFKNSTGEKMYETPAVYLHSDENIYSMEFFGLSYSKKINREKEEKSND